VVVIFGVGIDIFIPDAFNDADSVMNIMSVPNGADYVMNILNLILNFIGNFVYVPSMLMYALSMLLYNFLMDN
jgi:hypothetical protein